MGSCSSSPEQPPKEPVENQLVESPASPPSESQPTEQQKNDEPQKPTSKPAQLAPLKSSLKTALPPVSTEGPNRQMSVPALVLPRGDSLANNSNNKDNDLLLIDLKSPALQKQPAAAQQPAAAPAQPEVAPPTIDWGEFERQADVAGLVQALRSVLDHQPLLLDGIVAAQNMSQTNASRQRFFDAEGVDVVHEIVVRHRRDPKLQDAAITLLTSLSAVGKVRQRLSKEEVPCTAATVVTESLKANAASVDVQIAACRFLEKLLTKNVKKQKVGKLGLVPTVLQAIAAHRDNSGVVVAGFALLWTIAEAEKKRDLIATVEGCTAIVAAMRQHPTVANVQIQACKLLKRVAWGTLDNNRHRNAVHIANSGAFDAALEALQAHPSNDKLTKKILKVFWRTVSKDDPLREKIGETRRFELIPKLLAQYKGDTKLLPLLFQVLDAAVRENAAAGKVATDAGAVAASVDIIRIHKRNEPIVARAAGLLAEICLVHAPAIAAVLQTGKKGVHDMLEIAQVFAESKGSEGLLQLMRLFNRLVHNEQGLSILEAERPAMQLLLTNLAYNRPPNAGGHDDVALANEMADALQLEHFNM